MLTLLYLDQQGNRANSFLIINSHLQKHRITTTLASIEYIESIEAKLGYVTLALRFLTTARPANDWRKDELLE